MVQLILGLAIFMKKLKKITKNYQIQKKNKPKVKMKQIDIVITMIDLQIMKNQNNYVNNN